MKIAIVGATGNLGTEMVEEALSRGIEVTPASRSGKAVAGAPGRTIDLDNAEELIDLVNEHDATVISVPGHENAHQAIIAARPRRRVLAIGGAGTLVDDEGRLGMDGPYFPAEFRADSEIALHVLDAYRASDGVDWTIVTPPPVIDAGERTGRYLTGLDSAAGLHISREDFAVALIDELEHPQHRRERFTVAEQPNTENVSAEQPIAQQN